MDKKVIKAMFSNIVSKEEVRPQLMGVFFDSDCCVATDTHMLMVYKETNPSFAGKIMSVAGETINGQFPNYKRVFPAKDKTKPMPFRIDLKQLQKACAWFMRMPGFHDQDMVIIDGKGLNIKFLGNILTVISLGDDLTNAEMFSTPSGAPAVIKCPKFDALLMPMTTDCNKVDAEREEACPVQLSYENLINMFVFEGWKAREVADPMAWLE